MTTLMKFNPVVTAPEPTKKIQFCFYMDGGIGFVNAQIAPVEYDYVCLLGQKSFNCYRYDLFLAWNEGDQMRNIYIGHYNDGVI